MPTLSAVFLVGKGIIGSEDFLHMNSITPDLKIVAVSQFLESNSLCRLSSLRLLKSSHHLVITRMLQTSGWHDSEASSMWRDPVGAGFQLYGRLQMVAERMS